MLSSFNVVLKKITKKIADNKIKIWKAIMVFSIFLFLAVSVLFAVSVSNKKKTVAEKSDNIVEEVAVKDESVCSECVRGLLDGLWRKEESLEKPLVAIMIDNHPSARPQFGFEMADLVYEAEVEGNYTRFMAVYNLNHAQDLEKVGPVRSARSYFLDWAMELGAIYGHCGGSPEALAEIADSDIVDLNEFYNGKNFWRDKEREAPHNVMTSWDKLNDFSTSKNIIMTKDLRVWSFKEDADYQDRGDDGKNIAIGYSHPYFDVSWVFVREDNAYVRFFDGEPQLTGNGNKIIAKNIIIQTISADVVDEKLRLDMDTVGDGKAIFCLDGKCEEGEWKKSSIESRTEFYKKDGSAPSFNAGQTWLQIVRPEVVVEY